MKKLLLIFAIVIVGCSSPKIIYDYDTTQDFTKFNSFDFFVDAGEGLSDFNTKRIMLAIQNELNVKSIKRDSLSPDFYVNFFVKNQQQENRNTIGVGIGGTGRNVGFGISGGIPIGRKKVYQQLTIDFVRVKDDELFWQSISENRINEKMKPEEIESFYKNLISSILKAYPPKQK